MIAVSEPLARTVERLDVPAPPRWPSWTVAAGVPTILTGLHAAYYGQWIVDDAGLTFAYARSLATGSGPVLQNGAAPVEGFSNPTWVAVLAVGRWVRLFDQGAWFGTSDIVLFPKLAALLCCFGMFAAMFAIATTVTRRPVAVTIVAGAMTATVPSFVIWTTSGLENALFALAVMAIAAVLARAAVSGRLLAVNTAVGTGTLAALAALTRPDGIVYVAAFPIAAALTIQRNTLRRTLKASVVSVVAFAVPVGAYLLWRLVMFGDYVPNTARAKAQGLPNLADLNKPAALVGYAGWFTACFGIAVVAVAISRSSTARTAIAMVLVPLVLAVMSYVILRPDWMAQFRFATPVWPLAAIVLMLSMIRVLRDCSKREQLITATVAAIAAASSLAGFWFSAKAFRAEPTVGVCNIAQNTGYAFNGYADILEVRDGTLLAVDGGGTSLTSRLRFIDLSGLADRHIARFWQSDDMPGLRDYIFDELRPTFLKIFYGWAERDRLALAEDSRLERDYVLMYSGAAGGGDWVRRDAAPDRVSVAATEQWGRDTWKLVTERSGGVGTPIWWCGDTLRPTPFGAGRPASSPLTRR